MISLLWIQNCTSTNREYLAAFGSFTQHGQLFCTNRIQSRECVHKGSANLEGGPLNVGCEDHQPQRLSCRNGFTACLLQGTFIPEETQLWSIEQADVFCPLLLVLVLTRKSGMFGQWQSIQRGLPSREWKALGKFAWYIVVHQERLLKSWRETWAHKTVAVALWDGHRPHRLTLTPQWSLWCCWALRLLHMPQPLWPLTMRTVWRS
jgi:hypothetical protein